MGDLSTEICGECIWNDDGLCDILGYHVDDEDECLCKDHFERPNKEKRKRKQWK